MIRIYTILSIFLALFFPHDSHSQNWSFSQKLSSLDKEAADNFGFSTAISDSFMFVGAWWEEGELDNNGPINSAGSVYIFKIQPDGSMQEIQKLVSPNRETLGYFGFAVAIDGDFALVSAINEDEGAVPNAGAVYVYHREAGDDWVLEDRMVANDSEGGDVMGWSIALTEGYALLGSPNHELDENGANRLDDAGAAYLFERQPNNEWQQIKKLVAFDRPEDSNFGKYLDIDKQGIIIGAFNADHDISPLRAGYAYAAYNETMVFSSLNSSDLQKLVASDASSLQFFGWDVAISGKWAVAGASGELNPPSGGQGRGNGAAYFFQYENGMWVEKQKVYASDHENSGQFGRAIDIDGGACIIGAGVASSDENNLNIIFNSGAAHLFELQPNESWLEVQKFAGTGRNNNDLYGESVALHGNRAVVGAWLADSLPDTNLVDVGAVYVYERNFPLAIEENQILEGLELIQKTNNQGTVWIRNSGGLNGIHNIQLYSLQGQLLFEEEVLLSNDWKREFKNLPKGIYIVNIKQEGKGSKSWQWINR